MKHVHETTVAVGKQKYCILSVRARVGEGMRMRACTGLLARL